MRKLFNTLFVIIAAMVTFAGCAKEEVNAPANETKTVQFIAESIETKTHFGTPENGSYPTLWDNGDKVKVLLNLDAPSGVKKLEATAEIAEISSDSKSATFNAEMNADYVTDSYTFYAVAPSTAYNAKSSSEGRFTVQIPSEQTPQASSVDKAAQVIYAVSETTTSMPSSVSMHFRHMTAYGKFSLTNLSDKVSSISQVKIVAPEGICLSGKWNYMIADGSIVAHGDNASNFVTIKTTNTENIWFACAPVDASGKDVKFIVTTDKGDLEKTVRFPKAFESGKIATFAVNMSGIEPPVQEETTQYYQKVTSDLDDWSGKYLLVYETGKKVLSSISTTSTKYGVGTEVTITDGKIQATADVMSYQIEITKSSSVDEYLMNFGGQYLTWTSGNSLNVATSVSDNTTWTIAVSNGNATITNKKDKTRVIKWNSSSPRFACYTSGQTAVQLYKLIEDGNEGGETPDVPTAPILTVTPAIIEIGCAGGNEELSYTVTNPSDGVSVAVSATAEWIAIDDSTEGKVIISVAENTLTEVREATISLSYEGAETMTVVVTQKAWVDTSKIEELTVADFLAKDVNTDVWYKLTGTVTNITSTTYGNFDLVDETGSVYIYGLTKTQVTSNDKSFASLGIKEGDVVTLITVRGEHNGAIQGGGTTTPAYYVSHMSACAAPVISCADNTVTITAEDGATIYYTKDGTDPSTASDKYDKAFPITETVTVKAIAVAEGKVQSVVAEKSCTWVDPNAEQPGEGQKVEYTILFGTNYNSGKISSYTSTWSATNNGFKCTLANWNNNNNGWDYVKAGRKKTASVATITTANSISEALTTVKMTVDACTASKINSLKLYVSTSSDFTSAATYSASIATGDVAFNISSPVANAYYKIEVDCASGSSNGLIQVSKVVYSN